VDQPELIVLSSIVGALLIAGGDVSGEQGLVSVIFSGKLIVGSGSCGIGYLGSRVASDSCEIGYLGSRVDSWSTR
jgi:hypothetical protein